MILFFDTETTGLPKNYKAPVTDLENWPRLVQLAYILQDYDGNTILKGDYIIKPNGFTIPSNYFETFSNEISPLIFELDLQLFRISGSNFKNSLIRF